VAFNVIGMLHAKPKSNGIIKPIEIFFISLASLI
jgi:hypothetical protein